MKLLMTGFIIFFASLVCFAQKNPQIRVCHQHGVEFTVADVPGDQYGFCKVGFSFVGAIDMMNYFWEQKTPQSIENYIAGNTKCPNVEELSMPLLDGGVQTFCFFEDGSVMDSITLQLGRNNSANQPLNQFLGL